MLIFRCAFTKRLKLELMYLNIKTVPNDPFLLHMCNLQHSKIRETVQMFLIEVGEFLFY